MSTKIPFQWKCEPLAESLVLHILEQASLLSPAIARLSADLLSETNTRLFDWLDFVFTTETLLSRQKIEEAGFVLQEQKNTSFHQFFHPGAQLPRILLYPTHSCKVGIGVLADSIADFLMVRGEKRVIEGSVWGNYRTCTYSIENNAALLINERRGTDFVLPTNEKPEMIVSYQKALELWMTRSRPLSQEEAALEETIELGQKLARDVGQDRAAWTVLEGERRYWQSRNTAGQIQKNRQDRLGMGWANHDHHTFRSSREYFHRLVYLFELLGFHCRERFYAGKEAGWGAQVMENPVCRLVVFLDVDLSVEEIAGDFAHDPLPPLSKLGTIGLWCGLHGDSILRGGMHHLEAQFMFDALTSDLAARGVGMMPPFSSFPHLKQAFTVGEKWRVDLMRAKVLLDQKKITLPEYEKFIAHGAIGSHLENLQRREGYKGFNKDNVSVIIKGTDPRLS